MFQIEGTTTEEFKAEIKDEKYDFRFNCGHIKPTTAMSIDDKAEFIRSIWLHHIFFMPHAELEQMRKGFRETLQIELLVCLHGELIHSVLASTKAFDPTPKHLIDEVVVTYSPERPNKRTQEEAVMLFWSDCVCECEVEGKSIIKSRL